MCWPLGPWLGHQHTTTHAQMNHHRFTRIKRTEQVLAATICAGNAHARQSMDECFPTGPAYCSRATNFDSLNSTTNHMGGKPASNRFDLGKFRHVL
jgi:hypothetical protein